MECREQQTVLNVSVDLFGHNDDNEDEDDQKSPANVSSICEITYQ